MYDQIKHASFRSALLRKLEAQYCSKWSWYYLTHIILLPTVVTTRFNRKTIKRIKNYLLNVTNLSDLASNDADVAVAQVQQLKLMELQILYAIVVAIWRSLKMMCITGGLTTRMKESVDFSFFSWECKSCM